MENPVIRSKNLYRRLFHAYPGPARLRGKRRELAAVEVANAAVVLHHQGAPVRNVIEQALVVCYYFFLCVIGADPEHNRGEAAQVGLRQRLGRNQFHMKPELLKGCGNLIPSPHDVANAQTRGQGCGDKAEFLRRWLKIIVSAEILAGYYAIAFGIFFSLRCKNRPDGGPALLRSRRQYLEIEFLRPAILAEMDSNLFRLDASSVGNLQAQNSLASAFALHADPNRKRLLAVHAP